MKETIEVKAQGDKLVWKMDAEIRPNTEVRAHEGAEAILMYNGMLLNHIRPGRTEKVNTKGFFERRDRGVYELYGVNTGKRIQLNWGTRNSPEYKDDGYGVVLQVKCYGRCTARVENPGTLFRVMLADGDELTEEGLKKYVAEKLSAACSETVAEIAAEYRDKPRIEAAGAEVADAMMKKFRKSFEDNYGLIVEDSTVLGIKVTGAEELDRKTTEIASAKLESQLSDESKHQAMNAVDVLKNLNSAASPKNAAAPAKSAGPAPAPAAPKAEKKDFKFCVDCGKKLPIDAKFCSDCGRRQ